MATVSTHHRRHPAWLALVEELLLVVSAFGLVALFVVPFDQSAVTTDAPASSADATSSLDTPLTFFAASRPMMRAIETASRLESGGEFGGKTREAWAKAAEECRRFSLRPILVSGRGPVRVSQLEATDERAGALSRELDNTELTASEAVAIARLRDDALADAELIRRYRELINLDYWLAFSEAGSSENGLAAREAAWLAERAFGAESMPEARDDYEKSFAAWREVLDESDVLRADTLLADDLSDLVAHYRTVLERLDERFPAPFILQDVVDVAAAR